MRIIAAIHPRDTTWKILDCLGLPGRGYNQEGKTPGSTAPERQRQSRLQLEAPHLAERGPRLLP